MVARLIKSTSFNDHGASPNSTRRQVKALLSRQRLIDNRRPTRWQDGKIASASQDDLRQHAIARGDPGPRTVVQAMSSVNRGGSLTPAQIGLLVLVRICYSEYKRICMHANMQPRIYRGTCMCACICMCASCSRNQAEHCLFIRLVTSSPTPT